MPEFRTKSSLPFAYKRLLEEMQRLHFGRMEKLSIKDGLPIFAPPLRIVRDVKFDADNSPRPEINLDDFHLKAQTRALFELIARMRDATIECIDVRHGLPFRMTVEEPLAR